MENIALLYSVILLTGGSYAADPAPCTSYTLLNETVRNQRLWNTTIAPTNDISSLLCDDVPDGWYRLDGGEIATSCVPPYSCGTRAPVWMNDTVPSFMEKGLRQFCVDHDVGGGQGTCCTFSFDMDVHNCGDFLVYYLEESKILCPMALCIGDLRPCSEEEYSMSGFQPCAYAGKHPENVTVELTGPILKKDGFSFVCLFDYDTVNPNAAAEVTWMFSNTAVKTETVDYPQKNATFNSQEWIGQLGQNLSCSVRSYFKDKDNITYSSVKRSEAYWGALTIVPDRNFISEGEETTILIESTLPIVCKNIPDDQCELQLLLTVDGGKGNFGIFTVDSCNATLKRLDWNTTTKRVFAVMKVTSNIDPVVKENSTHTLDIAIVPGSNDHDLWKSLGTSLTLPRIDADHADCFLFGENHIRGIYLEHLYTLVSTGDFLMYSTPDHSVIDFKIQTRHRAIGDNLPSTCGVVVKHDEHYVTIDMCNADSGETEPLITQEGDKNGVVTLYQCGPADYELTTDSDIRVEVKVHLHSLEVYLHLPPLLAKYGHDGTCSYGGNKSSLAFSDITKYVLTTEQNLFENERNERRIGQASDFGVQNRYCDCNSNPDNCPATVSRLITDPVENLLTFCNKLDPPQSWTKKHPFKPEPPFLYENSRPTKKWPTPSGITESDAQTKCEDALSTLVPSYCKNPDAKVHPDYNEFVTSCTDDVKATDSYDYVKSSLQGFLWSCQISILKNPDLYMRNQNQYIPPAEVTSDLCHDFCNMHGQCVAGSCDCDADYAGEDCGVKVGAVPVIADILGGSECKSHNKKCSQLIVFTRDVIKGNKFTARITPIEIVGGEAAPMDATHTHKNMTFTSRYTLTFDLLPIISTFKDATAYGFEITISNDGNSYSQPVTYYVYDEVCHICGMEDNGWLCNEKEDSCRINGACYKKGVKNTKDPSQCCDPTKEILHWSTC